MTERNIKIEDLERLQEFEGQILSLDEEGAPKYSIDYEMESQIKFDFLIETFGVDRVFRSFESLGIQKDDLSEPEVYQKIYLDLNPGG